MKNYKKEIIDRINNLEDSASLIDIQKIVSAFFGDIIWKSKVGRKVFFGGIILAITSVALITILKYKIFDLIVYGFWTIIPPTWFLYEYTWLFPDEARFDDSQLSDLKYKHEIAGKIWAGLVVLITAIIYLKYGKQIFDT